MAGSVKERSDRVRPPTEMRTFLALIRATHPLPAIAVTALVGIVTAVRGADAATLGWVIASTGVGQASVGWSNDYLDRDRDAAAGRTDKPIVAGQVAADTMWIAALVALPASVLLSLPVGLPEAVIMLIAVSAAWAYNLGLKSTPFSWLPYAVAFGLAPAYIWRATGDWPPAWIVGGAALLGVGAHLLNVIPDLESDRTTALHGLPHRLGLRRSLFLACFILALTLALILIGGGAGPWTWPVAAIAVALIGAVAWADLMGRTRMGFRLAIAAAAAIVAVLVVSPSGLGG
jgi:4-hydroxybenzoate polyprenyltransferase